MRDLPNLTKPPAPGDYFYTLHWSCPQCGARVGQPCVRPPTMPEGMRHIPHAARIRANQRTADDQGRMW
jgi:hypothetical protein